MSTDKSAFRFLHVYARLYSSGVPGNIYKESLSAASLEKRNCKISRNTVETKSDDFILI